MTFIREEPNEYGTATAHFTCDTCGAPYSITPTPKNLDDWQNCMAQECASYDPHRDADVLFMSDKEIAEEKTIVSIDKLRQRRDL